MLLNFGKCKCIHIGHGNMDEEYEMGDAVLGRTTQEKDIGVTFSVDMKVSEQCGIAASKENQILGLIRRNIMYKEKQLIVPLYKEIVRPHLEYCIQAWRSYRKKDTDKLERIAPHGIVSIRIRLNFIAPPGIASILIRLNFIASPCIACILLRE